jgi:carboxymethylenebutenolidase
VCGGPHRAVDEDIDTTHPARRGRWRRVVARPASDGRRPGLLLFHEAFGVNGHIRSLAGRLAEQDYVTVAPELYHRTAPGFEGAYGDFADVRNHLEALTTEGLEADARVVHAWLAQDPPLPPGSGRWDSAWGGRASYIANSALPLTAAVSRPPPFCGCGDVGGGARILRRRTGELPRALRGAGLALTLGFLATTMVTG